MVKRLILLLTLIITGSACSKSPQRIRTEYSTQVASAASHTYTGLSYYVVAHQDDWELFRGEAAYKDLKSQSTKVVFIYTTSGDAGRTDGWWEAREQGAIAAVRNALPGLPLTIDVGNFNSHPVVRYTCGNSTSYFLRLPAGQIDIAQGYESSGDQSLAQLRDAKKAITAVDKSTSYQSWEDFAGTLQAIMNFERIQSGVVGAILNAPDYNTRCNPRDHMDHSATADALRRFVSPEYDRLWFVGYDTQNRAPNVNGPELPKKLETFLAYGNTVWNLSILNGNPSPTNMKEWDRWGPRSYSRFVKRNVVDIDNPPCQLTRAGP